MALINFNAANVEPQTSFEPIPNNWYNVTMVESEMKPTKAGDGNYLECQLKVIDGDFANRLLWLRLNLDNKNETAVEIAYGQLSAICKAVSIVQVADSAELHGKPFQVKVTVRPPSGDYEASNDIKGFKAVEGGGGGAATSGSAGGGDAPAWSKKKANKKVKPQEPELEEEEEEEEEEEIKPVVKKKKKVKAPEPEPEATVEDAEEEEEEEEEEEASGDAKPPWMKK